MKAKWITAIPKRDKTSLYIYKKTFNFDGNAKSFNVEISADTRYKFYLNGNEVVYGPCKSSTFVKRYEEIDCAKYLVKGENEILIKVLHVVDLDESRPLYCEYFATANHERAPALYFNGVIVTDNGEEQICSDESFTVSAVDNHAFISRGNMCAGVGAFEDVYGEEIEIPLTTNVMYTPRREGNCIGRGGVREKYVLEKRLIPIIPKRDMIPLKVAKEWTDENGNYCMLLETGRYTTDYVRFEYKAEEGVEIKAHYTECMLTRGEDGKYYKGVRDNLDGVIEGNAYDLLVASGKEQEYETFWYRVFRFIKITCSKKPAYFKGYSSRCNYDFVGNATNGGVGSFECSNELYNKMWEISQNTVECTAHETTMDCPYYEQAQYIGDGWYESLYAWKYSNDSQMQRKLLIDTAHSQQGDGQLLTVYPTTRDRHQNIVMTSAFFVYMLRDYLRYSGDVELVKSLTGVCDRALGYYDGLLNEQGLVTYKDGWPFTDWLAEWDNGVPTGGYDAPMTINSLIYIAALNDAAELCDGVGRHGLAEEYRQRSSNLVKAVNEHLFDKEAGLYVDVLGRKEYSEHTMMWAIIAGAIEGEDAKKLIEKTMTAKDIHRCGFPKNLHMLRALEKAGVYEQYAQTILSRWNIMIEKNSTTWWEDPVFQRSECHAWASVPAYEFSSMVLGVYPTSDGFKTVRIKPNLLNLKYAKGRVPTTFGYIDVSWKVENGKFNIKVSSSKPLEMEIILPNGKVEKINASEYKANENI